MNLKEHLQFLAMMVPTLLLLAAAVVSLAFPAQGAGAPSLRLALAPEVVQTEAAIVHDADGGP
ncbi:MAG: hypothetical protein ACREVR_02430 [Burkholderiales bacterium]